VSAARCSDVGPGRLKVRTYAILTTGGLNAERVVLNLAQVSGQHLASLARVAVTQRFDNRPALRLSYSLQRSRVSEWRLSQPSTIVHPNAEDVVRAMTAATTMPAKTVSKGGS
jgi:hypothetical protein